MRVEVIDDYSNVSTENDVDSIDCDSELSVNDSEIMYLHSVSKVRLLKAHEEVELAKDIEAGLYAQKLLEQDNEEYADERENLEQLAKIGRTAYDLMVSANLRLVVSMARKYLASKVPLVDLVQEGNIALIHAIKKFDYKRGYKLSTSATPWIRKAIITSTYQQSSRLPLGVLGAEKANKILKQQAILHEELQHEPTIDEIATTTNIPADVVKEILVAIRYPIELDRTGLEGTDAPSIAEHIYEQHNLYYHDYYPSEETGVDEEENAVANRLLENLQERDRKIMQDLYGLHGDGKTKALDEVAKELGVRTFDLKRKCDKLAARLGTIAQVAVIYEGKVQNN